MKEQIKELRIRIDGVSQLVKSMEGGPKFQLDISTKPKGLEVYEWLKMFEENNYLFVDTNQGESKGLIQSSELHKCYDSLILAKAWLGKVLGELGETTPYTNDGNRKTVENIEPTADTNKTLTDKVDKYISEIQKFSELNHIEKVDWLREEIELIINIVKDIYISNYQVSREFNISRTNAYNHLCEARFWLGFELQSIRESSTNNI